MDPVIVISLAVGAAVVVAYLLVMRVFFKDSQAADRKIDYTKMRQWKDED